VIRALLLAFALGSIGCESEQFTAPPQPDLFKVPYDFGRPEHDGGHDLSVPDLGVVDQAMPADLLRPADLASAD
jgi:hypothetical protein